MGKSAALNSPSRRICDEVSPFVLGREVNGEVR